MATGARILSGMAAGVFFLDCFGCWWLAMAFLALREPPIRIEALWAVLGIILLGSVGFIVAKAVRASHTGMPSSPEERASGRRIGRSFGIVFALEAAFIYASYVLLNARHLQGYFLVAVALIVGLHFLPLARIFRVSLYYLTGTLGALLAIAALWIRNESMRQVFIGFSMGSLLWLTGLAVVYRAILFKSSSL